MPKISVIVPIYKVEKYLVQCIDSILNQTLKDIEVILVDEGDMDACRYIIDHYEQTDNRVRAIHEKNGGYGASCNKGFEIATGEYISIIESDDFIEPTMYEEMYNYAKEIDADVVKTPYYEYKDKTKSAPESKIICNYAERVSKACPQGKSFSVLEYPALMGVHASLWSGIYRTSYMREKNIKFIQAKGGAYVDVGFRIDTLINTDKVGWLNTPFYIYRLTNDTSTTNNFNLSQMLERWKEVHEKFKNYPSEVYEKVGPELVWDEYVNTAGYLFNGYNVTEEQFKLIQDNFSYIPDTVIKNAPYLKNKQKKVMFDIKKGKCSLKTIRHVRWYSCRAGIHLNHSYIHLFKNLRKNILRLIFRIGGLYVIDFCIGKIK